MKINTKPASLPKPREELKSPLKQPALLFPAESMFDLKPKLIPRNSPKEPSPLVRHEAPPFKPSLIPEGAESGKGLEMMNKLERSPTSEMSSSRKRITSTKPAEKSIPKKQIIIENPEKILQMQELRRKEKKKRNELCVKLLRFSIWKRFVDMKKIGRIARKRALKNKVIMKFASQYGLLLMSDLEREGAEAKMTVEEDYKLSDDWFLKLIQEKIDTSVKANYWIKVLLSIDTSNYEMSAINNWLLKQFTREQYTLSDITPIYPCIHKEHVTIQSSQVSYCINLVTQSFNASVYGSRLILFTMSLSVENDEARFEKLMNALPDRANASLIIFYMEIPMKEHTKSLSRIKGKQKFQEYIERALDLRKRRREGKVGYYRFKNLRIYFPSEQFESTHVKVGSDIGKKIVETIDQALKYTELEVKLEYRPLYSLYAKAKELPVNLATHTIKGLNKYIAHFNAICEIVEEGVMNGVKERAKLVPEFISAAGNSFH